MFQKTATAVTPWCWTTKLSPPVTPCGPAGQIQCLTLIWLQPESRCSSVSSRSSVFSRSRSLVPSPQYIGPSESCTLIGSHSDTNPIYPVSEFRRQVPVPDKTAFWSYLTNSKERYVPTPPLQPGLRHIIYRHLPCTGLRHTIYRHLPCSQDSGTLYIDTCLAARTQVHYI